MALPRGRIIRAAFIAEIDLAFGSIGWWFAADAGHGICPAVRALARVSLHAADLLEHLRRLVPAHPVNVLGLDVFIVGIIKYVGLEHHSQEFEDVVQFAGHGLQKKVAAWRCNARKALLDGVALWIFRIHGEGDWS